MSIIGLDQNRQELEATYSKVDLDPENIPKHIAFVMDGNGRWAKEKNQPRTLGHKAGAEALRRMIKACAKYNIHYLSVYAFSTENWKRPEAEVSFLMGFFELLLKQELKGLKKNNVRVKILGDKEMLSQTLKKHILNIEQETDRNTSLQLNLLINYGSRQELTNAVKTIVKKAQDDTLFEISENTISDHLYTADMPDPDIFVRTSNEFRISNYLLWQLSYSELIFLEKNWPDMSEDDLVDILRRYQKRNRRFGGILSQ